jgi:predicted metal-dependent phosphoesterase TrpH
VIEIMGATAKRDGARDGAPVRALAAWAGLLTYGVLLGRTDATREPPRAPPSPPTAVAPPPTPSVENEPTPVPDDAAAPLAAPRFADALDVSTFQKGNIHTHSTVSDGDRPPEHVYAWYRDHGYNFLAVTDHNNLTEPSRGSALERKKRFVLISGEEVTMRGAGKQVHVNALCHKHTIGGRSFDTQGQALAWAVREILAQGGVALVNHPNWDWALTADDLPAAKGAKLLEIASGHPHVHTAGDAEHLSHEAIWDVAFGRGLDVAGVAVDDAHSYGPQVTENAARPGRAWIQVFAAEATRATICDALSRGRLYASTGLGLKRIVVGDATYAVYPADPAVEVAFIGADGRVLQNGRPGPDGAARYTLVGGEGYVRARLTSADGKHAWTQPSRVK